MEPDIFYTERINLLNAEHQKLIQRKLLLGWFRFTAVIAIAGAIYFLWPAGLGITFIATLLFIGLFVRLIFMDIKNKTAISHTLHLIKINNDEIRMHSRHKF